MGVLLPRRTAPLVESVMPKSCAHRIGHLVDSDALTFENGADAGVKDSGLAGRSFGGLEHLLVVYREETFHRYRGGSPASSRIQSFDRLTASCHCLCSRSRSSSSICGS